MMMKEVFDNLLINLKDGYDYLLRMRGADQNGFNYSMLENALDVSQKDFFDSINKNFSPALIQEVKTYCKENGYHEYSTKFLDKLYKEYMKQQVSPARCFVDMDGVLYKFDNTLTSLEPLYEEGYFRNLPAHKLAKKCMNQLLEKYPNHIYVLSHVLDSPYAKNEKLESLKEDFPSLDPQHIILVPYGESKSEYVPMLIKKNDILIDDYNHNLEEWKSKGGYAIKFVNDINDRHKSWKGSRIEYDDPELFESVDKIIQEQHVLEGIDEKTEQLFKERLKSVERIKI